jgi:penicillin-binding protein 1A
MATLAGIPTAPSTVNPVASAEAAKVRRAHVLGACSSSVTSARPSTIRPRTVESDGIAAARPSIEVDAPYVAEMVRNDMQPSTAMPSTPPGYKVFTTIDSRLQAGGTVALRTGLMEYDRATATAARAPRSTCPKSARRPEFDAQLEEFPIIGGLKPAIVEKVEAKSAKIYVKDWGS